MEFYIHQLQYKQVLCMVELEEKTVFLVLDTSTYHWLDPLNYLEEVGWGDRVYKNDRILSATVFFSGDAEEIIKWINSMPKKSNEDSNG